MMNGLPNWLMLAENAKNVDSGMPGWMLLSVVAVIFVVPMVLGGFIAKSLKQKEMSNRISFVLFAIVFAVMPFVWQVLERKLTVSRYEQQLAEWESRGKHQGITQDGIDELKKDLPDLVVTQTKPEEEE